VKKGWGKTKKKNWRGKNGLGGGGKKKRPKKKKKKGQHPSEGNVKTITARKTMGEGQKNLSRKSSARGFAKKRIRRGG